jgi:hypothetical protein
MLTRGFDAVHEKVAHGDQARAFVGVQGLSARPGVAPATTYKPDAQHVTASGVGAAAQVEGAKRNSSSCGCGGFEKIAPRGAAMDRIGLWFHELEGWLNAVFIFHRLSTVGQKCRQRAGPTLTLPKLRERRDGCRARFFAPGPGTGCPFSRSRGIRWFSRRCARGKSAARSGWPI